ncbi:endonuclease-reverse transcriptase [Plakobranchus ocellatus]|uniref:Endonuclease-reverse transcriptase n=1 Tax=Plakobranchus ocellatus TaxID=259542 RepID=A0AAV3ZCJ4_9GAST|nr:endonuclease-reverse transcriptase [Plakobranchus ocellatus]
MLTLFLRKRIHKCYSELVLLCAFESWTILNHAETVGSNGKVIFRRMMKISRTEKATNEDILNETERSLIDSIVKRQAKFFGHTMRSGKQKHLISTGKLNGKRVHGRQRNKIVDGLFTWLNTSGSNATTRATEYRMKWKCKGSLMENHGHLQNDTR